MSRKAVKLARRLCIRLTETERQALERLARQTGKRLSAVVRAAIRALTDWSDPKPTATAPA